MPPLRPRIYDVYGLDAPMVGDEPDRLAEILGVLWEEHDSDYRGRYLEAAEFPLGGGSILLQANDLRDSAGHYLQLPDSPQYRFLLFVSEYSDPDEIRTRLSARPQWEFIRRQDLTEEECD